MNGAVEAVVKFSKRRLKAVTRDRLFKEETLSTYLTEVEAVLNNRLVTSISDDVTVEPLTPNLFLIGRGNPNFRFNTSNELIPTFRNSGSQYKPKRLCYGSHRYKNIYLH